MNVDKKKIDLAMARKMVSRSEVAVSAGIPEATLRNLMFTGSCRPATAGRIAHALGVDVTEILADDEPERR